MEKLCDFIVRFRKQLGIVFLGLVVISLFLIPKVEINYDLSSYIPNTSPSKEALDIVEDEFGMQSSARIMLNHVSLVEAKEYKEKIEAIDGVYMVSWLDDSFDIYQPESFMDQDEVEKYYKEESALFDIMFEEDDYSQKTNQAVEEIYQILPDDANLMGPAIDTKSTRDSIQSEMLMIMGFLVPLTIVILILTTDSYFSSFIFILVILVSILLNLGTNIIFENVSFLTYSISAALQFAVSMDYSVFMLHQFEEEKKKTKDTVEAMKKAVHHAINSIFSSSLTTIAGFLALAFMSFGIGKDIGFVFAKGIVFSLLCVILLMPFLILTFEKRLEKSKHKSFLPSFEKFAKGTVKIGGFLIVITIVLVVPCFVAQRENHFLYGVAAFGSGEGTKAYEDEQRIVEKFGRSNPILLLVPNQSYYTEKQLVKDLEQMDTVQKVLTLVNTVPEGVPYDFIEKDLYDKFQTENYTRILIYVKTASESDLATQTLQQIESVATNYYGDEWKCTGTIPVTLDMKDAIESDYNKVNWISILAIFIILVFTFRSVLLPVILTVMIEAGIMINMAIPYFSDTSLIFMGYLIVSSIELGATIDYAILMTNHYLKERESKEKKEAVVACIQEALPSILTSGAILILAGYILKICSSLSAIADMGELIGRGALISVILVVVILPQVLALLDRWFYKNGKDKKKILPKKKNVKEEKVKANLFKKVKKMKGKRVLAVALVGLMLGNQVLATENILKNSETVYVNVDAYGKVEKINVYQDYQFYGQEQITSYGNYSEFQVLTGNLVPQVVGDEVTWNVSGENQLSYIGKIDLEKANSLPWQFNLTYEWNGVEIPASELVGKSGLVKVKIEILPNSAAPICYQNNYMLEITASFDMSKYLSVLAKDATEVTVGKEKQLMFIVLPGQEKTIEIEIGTEDFEMEGITFAMIPLQGDILEAVQNLVEDKNEMEDAFEQTNQSLDVILNQMNLMTGHLQSIVNGTENLQNGLNLIYDNKEERNENIEQLRVNLTELNDVINDVLEDTQYVKERVEDTNQLLLDIKSFCEDLIGHLQEMEEKLEDCIEMAEDLPEDIDQLRKMLLDTRSLMGDAKKLLGNYEAIEDIDIKTIAGQLEAIGQNAKEIGEEAYEKLMEGEGDIDFYQEIIGVSQEIGESLKKTQTELEKAQELMQDSDKNVSGLTSNLTKLQNDLNALAKSLDRMSENSEELPDTIEVLQNTVMNMREILDRIMQDWDENQSGDFIKIMEGIEHIDKILVQLQTLQTTAQNMLTLLQKELTILENEIHSSTHQTIDGTQDLLKDTSRITQESMALKQAKNTIYQTIKNNVNDLDEKTTIMNVDAEAEIPSFVSEKNPSPEKVQIFVKTASIKKSNQEEIVDLEPKEEKVGFLSKVRNIFAKIWNFFTTLFS